MRASQLTVLITFLALTVSCAHKHQDTKAVESKTVEKKVIIKGKDKKKEESKQLAYTCLVKKDQRTITLDKKDKGCEVNYTKFGDTQQMAEATQTIAVCDRVFNNIRSNIEGAGFKCKDGLAWTETKKATEKPGEKLDKLIEQKKKEDLKKKTDDGRKTAANK